MSLLFTSDLHFGHEHVLKFDNRPFNTIEEHDRALIELYNTRVSPGDEVYILGDVVFRAKEHTPGWYVKQLGGHKHLILGNHDRKLLQDLEAVKCFESIEQMQVVKENGAVMHLCHYPLAEWYGAFHDTWHIYGHIHNHGGETFELMKNRTRALNAAVCINNYMPASLPELIENNRRFIMGE